MGSCRFAHAGTKDASTLRVEQEKCKADVEARRTTSNKCKRNVEEDGRVKTQRGIPGLFCWSMIRAHPPGALTISPTQNSVRHHLPSDSTLKRVSTPGCSVYLCGPLISPISLSFDFADTFSSTTTSDVRARRHESYSLILAVR